MTVAWLKGCGDRRSDSTAINVGCTVLTSNVSYENLWVHHRRHHHLRFKLCVGSFCVDLGHVECTMFGFQCFLGGRHHHSLRLSMFPWWSPPPLKAFNVSLVDECFLGGRHHHSLRLSMFPWWTNVSLMDATTTA
jgi:hypothetical protein